MIIMEYGLEDGMERGEEIVKMQGGWFVLISTNTCVRACIVFCVRAHACNRIHATFDRVEYDRLKIILLFS